MCTYLLTVSTVLQGILFTYDLDKVTKAETITLPTKVRLGPRPSCDHVWM